MTVLDVLVIGGGPAGLSVVTGLARQLHRAVVFDSGIYRNALTSHMHKIATWDHKSPAKFRREARGRLSRYHTIQFESVEISMSRKHRTVYDMFPDIEGYAKCWVTGIFHCLLCHGFEERGCGSAGVLAVGDMANTMPAMHVARIARRLANTVTIYPHGAEELSQVLAVATQSTGIMIDNRPISRLVNGPSKADVEVAFVDSTSKIEGFLSHKPKTQVNCPFAEQLGLDSTPDGDIKTTQPFFSTSMPGVFAAGDCARQMKSVVTAMSSETLVAGGLAGQLQAELE
ncbi:hypothetical protein BDW74DRAFT_171338 [Aspergillus multicolor]|uniref:thioredoxin reductase gliT n=1 Tax=Aspergillus multicolor TaxID=41759 RepID=UPI003CCD38C1